MRSPSCFCAPAVDAADLIDDLGKFRRRHRLIGEGVESLLHLADHVLPHRDRIVALVCHWRPPGLIDECFRPRLFSVIPHCCAGAVNIAASICRLRASQAFCGARNRAIEFLIAIPFEGPAKVNSLSPSAAADRPRQRHRDLLRDFRRRRRRADAADHGARRPDDPLGRRFLPAAGGARLSRHPLRQSRHRQIQQDDRRQAPDADRTAQAAVPENPGRRALQAVATWPRTRSG